ncbi:hypothetical protein [Tenacibaculum ovolyticum]|uniref:hypothetical protein n=1 Tax=Tenacibaculum ovolyticum TaxID=104270 RepID=UPI0007ECC0EE|nr:hypothetical protein [Tenacibaculum ovolyticum]
MVNTLQLKEDFKQNQNVFLVVLKASKDYQINRGFSILDMNNNYVTKAYIHSIKEIPFYELDKETALLDKNVTLDIYKEILTEIHKIEPTDLLYKIVFSTSRPILSFD